MNGPERALIERALVAMRGCVRRLERSHAKLRPIFPLQPDRLAQLGPGQEEAIDAFLKRFEQLITTIQDQVFPGIAVAEGEDRRAMSRRDVAELMERLGAIPSATEFRAVALIRNKLSHLYPDDPARQVANLNSAFEHVERLLAAAKKLADFITARYAGRP